MVTGVWIKKIDQDLFSTPWRWMVSFLKVNQNELKGIHSFNLTLYGFNANTSP